MANWRQIQARIRKAKNSPEASAKLSELYAKTRDAMVAYELASVEERAAHNDEAVRWYTTAHERFRRQDWKKKVAEALTRLGAPIPVAGTEPAAAHETPPPQGDIFSSDMSFMPGGETFVEAEAAGAHPATESVGPGTAEEPAIPSGEMPQPGHKRRRRGRRGGRGRRRGGPAAAGLPASTFAPSSEATHMPSPPSPARFEREAEPVREKAFAAHASESSAEPAGPATRDEAGAAVRVTHGRSVQPGGTAIASRLAHLESMLRRLLGGQLHKLDEADDAPAGPGVFLLSDSDLVTSYYVESCKTLRIGVGQLLRGARGGRVHPGGSLRARLAENLGITEAKVSDYLKKHCVVRWIQLDDEASHLAHFAIGVLRTPLNEE